MTVAITIDLNDVIVIVDPAVPILLQEKTKTKMKFCYVCVYLSLTANFSSFAPGIDHYDALYKWSRIGCVK